MELEVKAQREIESNMRKLYEEQMDSLKDYGLANDLEINAGIIHIDKDHRKTVGPRI